MIDELNDTIDRFPPFTPHRLLCNGHLQTVAGIVLRGTRRPCRAVPHPVLLPDGDVTILHDDRPDAWQPTSPTAILLHGLTGSHQSSYMVQAAARLNEAGVRTFRMDMRACGAGEGLSRMPYHAGISQDLLAALERVVEICPASPISVVGFSVGGNIALKLAGEAADRLPPQLSRLVVISPPIDLGVCVDRFSKGAARIYDRYIARMHYRHLLRSASLIQHAPHVVDGFRPRSQRDFDRWYTAAMWGFESVDKFYADTSSCHVLSNIRVPTLLIASRDDPLVPVELFEPLEPLTSITLHLTDHGGHLGFIGRRGPDPDGRWLDWRIVDYITARWRASAAAAA
ncbi:MAG: alpha/beta fold hydrolase [Planctomycetota bacterium]|nr:alpha/beta fold hydrolase [Planctomycetota bacterium]